jgi:flagellar biosynthetic protein FlhB
MADRSGKTEQPTQRRIEKARREGQFPAAREFVSALQFLVLVALLGAFGARWFATLRTSARWLFTLAFSGELRSQDFLRIARRLCWVHLAPLAAVGLGVVAVTLALRLITTRFGLSLKKLAPDFGRLNPVSRLQELPRQNLPALIQALILLPVFLWAVYAIARDKLPQILTLPLGSVEGGAAFLAASLMQLFWKASVLFLVFGSVDLFRQMRRYQQDLKMSKQEIHDEMKETEGNPQTKSRIRRIQRSRARRRMMQEVPKATALVVNPTHFAVALRYQSDSMSAPKVVAKGKNYLALRIRQIAVEHQVPIVENPPLAQALYKSVDVGQEIPPHLYRAVAEILAYIFKLMNGRPPR